MLWQWLLLVPRLGIVYLFLDYMNQTMTFFKKHKVVVVFSRLLTKHKRHIHLSPANRYIIMYVMANVMMSEH